MEKLFVFLVGVMFLFSIVAVSAQGAEELGNPGITPDSAFYFLDRAFDWAQSAEGLANEKAAETALMAQEGKMEAMNKSLGLYERAMVRFREKAQNKEQVAERVANVTTTHLIVLGGVLEQVSEQARQGIEKAINASSEGRKRAIEALESMNPERGELIRTRTQERLEQNISEEVRERLNLEIQTKVQEKTEEPLNNSQKGQENQGGFFDY